MSSILEKPFTINSLFELLMLMGIGATSTAKLLRGSPRLLPQIAVGVTTLLFGAYLWSSKLAGHTSSPSHTNIMKWELGKPVNGSRDGGLRIVVFGGGDVATPPKASKLLGGPNAGWTDILCQQASLGPLNCALYLSFLPFTDSDEGAIVSNSLFEAALTRASSSDNATIAGLDYSWLAENYPTPPYKDLFHQIDTFLVSPRPQRPPRETLWIFSVGFWDIWSLAALPRKLASRIIETQAQQIFTQLEILYHEAQRNDSVAFSDYYANVDPAFITVENKASLPRPSFRVFIPRPFDISLTPGFENTRPIPPPPHTKAEQVRNAAFLAQLWDKTMQDMLDEWVRLPDPEEANDDNDDLSDIQDADLLLSKRSIKVHGHHLPLPRREVITYDVSGYIRDLIVQQQLRNADIVDHNGLGSSAMAEGYSEVWEPCIRLEESAMHIKNNSSIDGSRGSTEELTGDHQEWNVCDAPNDHLFWTEFTVNRKAIFEVGRRAAELLKRHEQMEAEWVAKAQHPLSSLRQKPDEAPLRSDASET
ncbi:hypothetical protein GGR54DRAFT_648985 [Hypoxylon sp. NC1633]|nr:hypothetical protein GGR54DRAFT_648985 [Hypoxylon sp. NC1633]